MLHKATPLSLLHHQNDPSSPSRSGSHFSSRSGAACEEEKDGLLWVRSRRRRLSSRSLLRFVRSASSIARRASAGHSFNLSLALGDDCTGQRYIVQRRRVLLTIMDHPPQHVRNGLSFVGIGLIF